MLESTETETAPVEPSDENAQTVKAIRRETLNGLAITPAGQSLQESNTLQMIEGLLTPHPVEAAEFVHQSIRSLDEVALKHRLTPSSVGNTVLNCAHLGLVPGEARGWAYFVPFKNGRLSKERGMDVHDLQLVVGYQGYIELGYRSGFLADVYTEVVLQGEELERHVDETGAKFRHELPKQPRPEATKDNVTHSYVIWETRHGVHGHVFVDASELRKIYNPRSDAWKYAYGSQSRKTAVRRAQKLWQTGPFSHEAAYLDEQAERGELQRNLTGVRAPVAEMADDAFLEVDSPTDSEWLTQMLSEVEHATTAERLSGLTEESRLAHHEGVADDRELRLVADAVAKRRKNIS